MAYNPIRERELVTERLRRGLCRYCGNPKGDAGTAVSCGLCRTKRNRQRRESVAARREDKACQRCGNALDRDGGYCANCLSAYNKAARKRAIVRATEGRCYRCNGILNPDQYLVYDGNRYPHCVVCFFKKTAKIYLGNERHWQKLKDLFDGQRGLCAFTQESLVLGLNASLDHDIPVSRGGPTSIKNLQWVTKTINTMKRDMTGDEFVALCRKVVANA